MSITLIIISLTILPNSLFKVTTEEVGGYNSIKECYEDQVRILERAKILTKPNFKIASVTCKEVGSS